MQGHYLVFAVCVAASHFLPYCHDEYQAESQLSVWIGKSQVAKVDEMNSWKYLGSKDTLLSFHSNSLTVSDWAAMFCTGSEMRWQWEIRKDGGQRAELTIFRGLFFLTKYSITTSLMNMDSLAFPKSKTKEVKCQTAAAPSLANKPKNKQDPRTSLLHTDIPQNTGWPNVC